MFVLAQSFEPFLQIRVLVAGGCNGWCKESPAISSAEMYDPDTNLWSRDQCYKTFYGRKLELFHYKLECLSLASLSRLV
jgi:hypothetical protein